MMNRCSFVSIKRPCAHDTAPLSMWRRRTLRKGTTVLLAPVWWPALRIQCQVAASKVHCAVFADVRFWPGLAVL